MERNPGLDGGFNELTNSSASQKGILPMSARRRNRWRTFSLRSFLILVFLTGLSIGFWVSTVQPMQRQWEAVDRFLAVNAEIETSPSNLPWLAKQFLHADRSSDVTMIKLPPSFKDAGEAVKGLKHLPHLERLYLPRQRITDEDIAEFSKLKKLKRLALWGNQLTDASVQQLASLPNLEVIDLKKNQFTWRALLPFQDRPNVDVRHDFKFDNATSAELETMVHLNNQTRKLTLKDYAPGIVAKAFQWLPKLEHFAHQDWSNFDTDDWQTIAAFGEHRACHFSLEGDAPVELPGLSSAGQVLQPKKIRISGFPNHKIHFKNGMSNYVLSAAGDLSDLESPDLFWGARDLIFSDSSVQDLAFLHGTKNLKEIQLSKCPNLTDISGISNVAAPIFRIEIRNCESLNRLSGWENDKLRYLRIIECPELDRLENFGKFKALEWLSLKQLPKLSSLESLSGLNKLTRLEMANVAPELSLSSLPTLKKLYTLDLSGSTSLRNLDGMKKLPKLKRVNLFGCSNLEQIVGIQANDLLRGVNLNETRALKSLEGLSGMSQMNSLSIRKSGLQSLEGLGGLESLEELTLEGCDQLVSCGKEFTLPYLKKLRLEDCKQVTDLSGLVAPKLSNLFIGGRSEIAFADVGNLPKFTKLERLSLQECPSLHSLKSLNSDSKIVEASFHQCPNLVDFTGAAFESVIVSKQYLDWFRETKEDQPLDLTPLKDVKKLKIRRDNISSFKGLESLTQLQELDLNIWRLDVNSLRLPESLQALRLKNDRTAKQLTVLERLPNLKILKLVDCRIKTLDCQNTIQHLEISDCSPISSFHGLEKLTEVRLYYFPFESNVAADLSFLSAAPNLRALSISAYRNLRGFDFLKQTKQLKYLYLEWKYSAYNLQKRPVPPDISEIEHCKNLDTFILDSCDLPGIEAVGKLDIRDLRLNGFHFPNLELVSQMKNLEVLKLENCMQLKSLDGIGPKPKLSSLYIEGLEKKVRYSQEKETLPAYDISDVRFRKYRRRKWWTVVPSEITP